MEQGQKVTQNQTGIQHEREGRWGRMRTRGRRGSSMKKSATRNLAVGIQAHFKALCTMQHSLVNRLPCISMDKLTHKVASNNRCHYRRRYVHGTARPTLRWVCRGVCVCVCVCVCEREREREREREHTVYIYYGNVSVCPSVRLSQQVLCLND